MPAASVILHTAVPSDHWMAAPVPATGAYEGFTSLEMQARYFVVDAVPELAVANCVEAAHSVFLLKPRRASFVRSPIESICALLALMLYGEVMSASKVDAFTTPLP